MLKLIENMPAREYHNHSAYSNSDLKTILQSSLWHLKYKKENPSAPGKDLVLGSLLHTMILEPEKIDEEYAIAIEKKLQKECETKEEWEEYKRLRDMQIGRASCRERV